MDCTKSNEKKIYVSNIPKHVDSKQLQRYFETFGSVYSAVVIGAKKGKSLSYGFVSFSSKKSLEKALVTPHVIDGCQLTVDTVSVEKAKMNLVKYAQGGDPNVFLFIQDIPKDVDRQIFINHFLKFGELVRVRLVSRADKNKDFVYLQYKELDSAAVAKSQKHRIPGLSSENITLVCKVGIFRNQKQVQVMEEAEDILVASRPGTDVIAFSESDVNDSDGRPTGSVVLGLPDNPFPTLMSKPREPVNEDCDENDEMIGEEGDSEEQRPCAFLEPHAYFRLDLLDGHEENYRFNRRTAPLRGDIGVGGVGARIRLPSEMHLTVSDIGANSVESPSDHPSRPPTPSEDPPRPSIGAIGSERNNLSIKEKTNKKTKSKSTFSGFAKVLKSFGAALRKPFKK